MSKLQAPLRSSLLPVRRISGWALLPVCLAPQLVAAAEPACAAVGAVPRDLVIARAEVATVASSLATLNWSNGQKITVVDVHVVTGRCATSVTGFADNTLVISDRFSVSWQPDGQLSPAVAAPAPVKVPHIPDRSHDDHSHGAVDFGVFVAGAKVAEGSNAYYVAVWRPTPRFAGQGQGIPASTVAVFAHTSQGVFSAPAPLMRSMLPIRGLSYTRGDDATSGMLGITQVSGSEVRLIRLQWNHQDYSR